MVGIVGAFDTTDAVGDTDADTAVTVGDVVAVAATDPDTGAFEGAMVGQVSWGMMKHDRAKASSSSVEAQ
jgi:hypothetical protein